MIVFNDLRIDHLPKNRRSLPPNEPGRVFGGPDLLNLEATTSYIIDSSPDELSVWDRCNQRILLGD